MRVWTYQETLAEKQNEKRRAADWLTGFNTGCADIDHGLPVRHNLSNETEAYREGYNSGYLSKVRRALDEVRSATYAWCDGSGVLHGDSLSECDIADMQLERERLSAFESKLEAQLQTS
jgi:hypothetical protein